MRSDLVILPEPGIDCDLSLFGAVNHSALSTSRLSVPLKRSLYPFPMGCLDRLAWLMPTLFSQSWKCSATNSGPLSERMNSGLPCFINTGCNASVRSHWRSFLCAQRLTGVFIHDFVTAPIAELIVNEVDGPDMVGVCGPQPYDRAVLMIKPPPLLMPVGQLQAFFAP